jgi:uncharacterized protein with HEPN domain
MPDQSSAADEHALLQEITAPLAALPDDAVQIVADVEFPIAFRGYDRLAVDAYVKRTSQLVAELQSTRSPEAAVRRALERVGEQISGILKRAHETAEQITTQSRREAEDRLVVARDEAAKIAAVGEQRVKDLDAETDRIWAERLRIVEDARELAAQLLALADEAAARFPPAEEATPPPEAAVERPATALFDAEGERAEPRDSVEPVGPAAEEPPAGAEGEPPAGAEGEPQTGAGEAPAAGAAGEPAAGAECERPMAGAEGERPADAKGEPGEDTDDPEPTRVLPPIREPKDSGRHGPPEPPPTAPHPGPTPPPADPPEWSV